MGMVSGEGDPGSGEFEKPSRPPVFYYNVQIFYD